MNKQMTEAVLHPNDRAEFIDNLIGAGFSKEEAERLVDSDDFLFGAKVTREAFEREFKKYACKATQITPERGE